MDRRQFLKEAAATAATLGLFPASLEAVAREVTPGKLEKRSLGRTGAKVSVLTFPGNMLNHQTPDLAAQLVREGFEAGITQYDVAPEYGTAEELLGPALEPYRKKVFLSCKTAKRTAAAAEAELDRSLKRLRTDHFDLYQLHHVTGMDEVETIFGPDGALKTLVKAKKDGRARHLGFSAHSVEAAMALMDRFPFDTIMFPVNYSTWNAGNFGPQVLAKAHEKKMGIIALKAMAKRPWPPGADRSLHPHIWYEPMLDPAEVLMGLRFTLSHPVATACLPTSVNSYRVALKLGPKFTPLKPAEVEEMKRRGMAVEPMFRA